MTIPAIAPPLRPLLAVVEVMPAALLAPVPVGEAVADMKGTVVVIEPVDVVVVMTLLVGRIKAVAVFVGATTLNKELLPAPLPSLAAHWPAYTQYCPTAQQMVPQGLSVIDESHEIAETAGATAEVVVPAPKKELYVDTRVRRSVSTNVVV